MSFVIFFCFFVHVGPNLAENTPTIKYDADENTIMDNVGSIFLGKLQREEILNIVKTVVQVKDPLTL